MSNQVLADYCDNSSTNKIKGESRLHKKFYEYFEKLNIETSANNNEPFYSKNNWTEFQLKSQNSFFDFELFIKNMKSHIEIPDEIMIGCMILMNRTFYNEPNLFRLDFLA